MQRVPGAEAIAWRPWGAAAFEESRVAGRPLLLRLTATWCRACQAQEHEADADGSVMQAVAARFVPVRVDVDRRPDLRDRYSMGGLPTTAVLAADGRVLTGATSLAPADFLRLLKTGLAATRNAPRPREAAPVISPRAPIGDLAAPLERLVKSMVDSFDWANRAFGIKPNFPQPQATLVLMAAGLRTGIPFAQKAALLNLSAMPKTDIYDPVDGGFFRYCEGPKWQGPHHEKLLEDNAQLLQAYSVVAAWARREEDRRVAREVAGYMDRSLAIPSSSLWGGSQAGDEDYYARMGHARKTSGPPGVDTTVFAHANAHAISAFATAGLCLNDPKLIARAGIALAELIDSGVAKDDEVFHFQDTQGWHTPGLLRDAVAIAAAALDVFCATAQSKWLDLAARMARWIGPQFADPDAPGLVDRRRDRVRPDEPALDPDKPVTANAEAASLFLRLAASTGVSALKDQALRILEALSPLAGELGPSGAPLGLALVAAQRGVVVVEASTAGGPQPRPALPQEALAAAMALGPVTLRLQPPEAAGDGKSSVSYAVEGRRSEEVDEARHLSRALRSVVAITDSI